jgi:formylglycine-generating enzyme required for sulfatase activity
LVNVGNFALCDGGYGGIFDMIGNAAEWEDSCDDPGDAGDQVALCMVRGGSFRFPVDASTQTCTNIDVESPRQTRSNDIGFRCCAP